MTMDNMTDTQYLSSTMNCEDCNGAGWVNSYSYGSVNKSDGYYIEHCGSCSRFKSDQEAYDYVETL
jgi:transcription elongation factor Elf1